MREDVKKKKQASKGHLPTIAYREKNKSEHKKYHKKVGFSYILTCIGGEQVII
jgi:hypothetical protein